MSNKLNYKLLNILIIISIICLLYFIKDLWLNIIIIIYHIISPFILSFSLAYIIYPIEKYLINAGSPKWLAILSISIFIIGFLFIIILLTIPLLYEQSLLFISNISLFISNFENKYAINLSNLDYLINNIINNLGNTIPTSILNILGTSINILSISALVICSTIYFLIDMSKIRLFIKHLFNKRNRTYRYLLALDKQLSKYILGIGLDILLQTIEYTLVFALIGHPNYLILGILSGISAIIPWLGGVIVAIISLLVSSVISLRLFILTAIISLICPIIDGNIIGPKVYGKTNSLHPILVIFAVSTGGMLGGFWGIVISLPTVIIIKTTYNYYQKDIFKHLKRIKDKK